MNSVTIEDFLYSLNDILNKKLQPKFQLFDMNM